MASTVELVIKAIDNASGTIKKVAGETGGLSGATGKLNDAFKNATGISLGTASAWGIAGMAVNKLYGFIKDSVVETQAYNLAMVDMARKMGTTTEEASRLVQVGDDVRLSQEQISTAMNIAIRNGVDPSIKGLAALADQYTALNSGTERGQFLLQTFGRSGMEMGKLLELGGAGILSASEAINENLIVTEKAAEASKNYYAATDSLNDAFTGLKYTIGNDVIPKLTEFINLEIGIRNAIDGGSEAVKNGGYWAAYYAVKLEAAKVATEKLNTETRYVPPEFRDVAGAVGDAAAAHDEATAAILAEVAGFKALTPQFLFNIAAANMDADAAMNLAIQMGLVDTEAIAAKKIMDELAKKQKDGALTAGQYADAVAALNGEIGQIHDATATLTIIMRQIGGVPSGLTSGTITSVMPNPFGATAHPQATGIDDFTVPPGYPNDTYPLRVESGERVTVTPAYDNANGRRGSGQGGHVFYGPINFTVTNEASMADIMNSLSQL